MASDKFLECLVEDIAANARNAIVGGPFGSDLVSKDYVLSGVPVIRGANMGYGRWVSGEFVYVTNEKADSLSSNCARAGDIIFTQRGTLGQVALIPNGTTERYLVSQSQMKLTVDSRKADALFLYYVFTGAEQQEFIRTNAIQTGVPHTNLGILKKTPVRLPSLNRQKSIARILASLDDKIDLNRRINQTLEAMAQALFKSWFVDFDPVKAKIAAIQEGRDPLRAAMSAISGKSDAELDALLREQFGQLAATAALFPDEMETSELGEIPRGWGVEPIGSLVECLGGTTPDTKNPEFWEPGEYAWTTPKDLSGANSPVLLSTERKISKKGLEKIGSGLLPVGTLLMSSRAPIGYLAILNIPAAINQGYIAMLPGGKLPPHYIYFWCKENIEWIKGNANGSTFLEISKKAFRPLVALKSSNELLGEFIKRVELLFSRIVVGEKESVDLATLRDSLLPKLLSGELSVAEAIAETET